jgi:hypothetical protein
LPGIGEQGVGPEQGTNVFVKIVEQREPAGFEMFLDAFAFPVKTGDVIIDEFGVEILSQTMIKQGGVEIFASARRSKAFLVATA